MVKLNGILEYSMGGFLCLRGFASFKMLSAISEPSPEVQRDLIAQHQGEMAEFLNGGEYRFFPEVILSLNLTDGRSEFDKIDLFHSELRSGQTWNKSIGGFQISISQNVTKNVVNAFDPSPRLDRINIAHLKFDEKEHRITRIDRAISVPIKIAITDISLNRVLRLVFKESYFFKEMRISENDLMV